MIRTLFCTTAIVAMTSSAAACQQTPLILDATTQQRCLQVLRQGMQGKDLWPSIHAAEGLTLAGHGTEVIEYLQPRLAQETDDQKRCGIARELVRAGDRSYANVMLKILAADNSHGHVHAAESLYKVSIIGDGTALRKAFQQHGNMPLKLMAAGALGRCGNPDAMQFLRSSLNNEDANVLRIAAWILGRIGGHSDIARLRMQLSRSEDALLTAYLQHSLAALGDSEGLAALLENLDAEDPAIRTYAATFAGDAHAVDAVQKLTSMLNDPHPDAAYRAAQSLLQMTRPSAPDPLEDISRLLFAATPANPRYTEGSIVELRNGSLLYAVTEFQNGGSDFAKAQIIGRVSSDEGRTWKEAGVLQENNGDMNVMSVTLRRLPDESLAMFYLQKNSHSDLRLYVRHSTDEAASFGPAIRVTSNSGYHVVNNDRITLLSSGRLLAPAASTEDVQTSNHFVSHCYLSDDNGTTWRIGSGHVDADKRGAMEPEVIELTDGRVMMIIRNQLGYIGKSYSTDGGDTWSAMTSLGVRAPEAPATLRRIPATGDLLLIWNDTFKAGAGHGGKRTPLSAAISKDEGATWKTVAKLESDPDKTYAYTSLTFIRNRAVLSYWESGPATGQLSSRFRSLPVSWFYQQSN